MRSPLPKALEHMRSLLAPRGRVLSQRGRVPRHRNYLLLETLARLKPHAYVVQIGSNEDAGRNPLRDVVCRSRWRGVIADPIPEVADQLRRVYGEFSRVSVDQVAIASAEGDQRFYYDPAGSYVDAGSVPPDGGLIGALRREVLYLAPNYHPDLDDRVAEIVTPCVTFESLCRRHDIGAFDILRIDTGGDEAEILGQVDLDRYQPVLIIYNHWLLGAGVRNVCERHLRACGYDVFSHGKDTWCFSGRALPTMQAMILVPMWRWIRTADARNRVVSGGRVVRGAVRRAVGGSHDNGSGPTSAFPLTDEERRYLKNGYDDRTPLPPGAAAYLSPDNPQLLALQREYASLELPAVRHHLWTPDNVAKDVDLRYFRGDNLYLWHYPEHPRAMALKLFLYRQHIEDRGAGELLEVLSEDGSFGCWTTEVSECGKISRDLLDSVNEIRFLDRQLGVLTKQHLRVLDIGAGYGRLAYRMAQVVPDLADYCCVDAVAESTFLADYYLKCRGCVPPARVLPLGEVPLLQPGTFDLAVNVHSFSECTMAAIKWWVSVLQRLRVPFLFVVPNEADGILSREADGSYQPVLPVLQAAGYVQVAKERAIADRATRDLLMLNDNFYLFSLTK